MKRCNCIMSEHHSYQGYSTEYMIRKDGETYRDSREKEKGRKTERERENRSERLSEISRKIL